MLNRMTFQTLHFLWNAGARNEMAHRVKCTFCKSCMSPIWILPTRYYYCSFCKLWYAGKDGELQIVENPNKDKIEAASNKLEDPIFEDTDEDKSEV